MSITPPNIGNIITSATVRKVIYGVYAIAAFVLAAVQVGFSATPGAGQPVWLTVSLAVSAFVGGAVGGLAVANAGNPPSVTTAE